MQKIFENSLKEKKEDNEKDRKLIRQRRKEGKGNKFY